ncbi:MAG TPA: anti-sigma factor [Fimbriimonadaceae bacterium]|nr:anti-sigma factor [Fimbriimonadaceae bacterium]
MTCEEVRELLGPFYDNEITDVLVSKRLAEHLETCPSCAAALEAMTHVSRALRESPRRYAASDRLKKAVEGATGVEPLAAVRERITARPKFPILFPIAAVLLLSVFVVVVVIATRPSARLEQELVADHVRSLQVSHLFDVASSNQHVVKPWFQGKLDFSPKVPDLEKDGFPLEGGRLEYVANRPAAALVYLRGQHTINVFCLRATNLNLPGGVDERNGFNLVAWTSGDLTYWAVSDVNPDDLSTFKNRFVQVAGD